MHRRGELGRHQQPGMVPETLTTTKSLARRARSGLFAAQQRSVVGSLPLPQPSGKIGRYWGEMAPQNQRQV